MEMMDMPKASRWLDDSCTMMTALRAMLASHAKINPGPLRGETIAAGRGYANETFKVSLRGAITIQKLMTAQMPIVAGHNENYFNLIKALARYDEEVKKTREAFKENPADPAFVSCYNPDDDNETIVKKLDEKMKSESAKKATSPSVAK